MRRHLIIGFIVLVILVVVSYFVFFWTSDENLIKDEVYGDLFGSCNPGWGGGKCEAVSTCKVNGIIEILSSDEIDGLANAIKTDGYLDESAYVDFVSEKSRSEILEMSIACDKNMGSSGGETSPPTLPIDIGNSNEDSCVDSDGGRDYDNKGFVDIRRKTGVYEDGYEVMKENKYFDICVKDRETDRPDSSDLSEYYCEDSGQGSFNTKLYRCPNECSDGMCI